MLYSAGNPQEVNLSLQLLEDRGIWFRNADGSVTKLTDEYEYRGKQHLAQPQGEVWFYGKFAEFIISSESVTVEGFAFNDLESDKWSELKRLQMNIPCKANIIQLPKKLSPEFNSLELRKSLNNTLKFVGWDTNGQNVRGSYWGYSGSQILAETDDQLFHNLTARDGTLRIHVPDNND